MAAPIARSNTPKQLVPKILNAIVGDTYGEITGETDGLFEEMTSDKAKEQIVAMPGFGTAPTKSEGGVIFYDTTRETWTATAEHTVVALGFQITEEQVEDNQYMAISKRLARAVARAMANTYEQRRANVLNFAFNSAYTQGPEGDGQPLVSTSHPTLAGGNQSNLIAADFSETAVEQAIISITKATDERGIYIGLRPKTLWIPPELTFGAHRLLNSTGRVGTADNDTNAIKDRNIFDGMRVVTRLTDSDGWFIQTTATDGLMFYTRSPLMTKDDGDFDTGNFKYKARQRYSAGPWGDWRAIYGSAGV